ncbi:MAG: hypothetical protein ACKVP3_11745 [Hyphomicrobiaceae bacterium]
MIYSVWRVAAVAHFLLGTAGLLMKMFHPGYAGDTKAVVTAAVLMVASGWWLYKNEIQPKLASDGHDSGLARS